MKTITLLFSLACLLPAPAQNADSLRAFALRHDEFFRSQVSRFYPVPEHLLDAYSEDWKWRDLSENQSLAWSERFVRKYDGLVLKWLYFQNPKIIWTAAKIDSLGEDADWKSLSQNPSLPLTVAFLKKYERKIVWELMVQNPAFSKNKKLKKAFPLRAKTKFWEYPHKRTGFEPWQVGSLVRLADPNRGEVETPELMALLPRPIATLTVEDFKKFSNWWWWRDFENCSFISWNIPKIEALLEDYSFSGFLNESPEIYRQVIQPHLDDALLADVMRQLNPPEAVKFYAIKPRLTDEFGIVPDAFTTRRVFNKDFIGFPEGLSDTFKMPEMVLDDWEPPLRFTATHDWGMNMKRWWEHTLIVSPKVKAVLERFKLPPHRFYPFKLSYHDPLYGSDSCQYFVLHLEKGVDLEHAVFENIRFFTAYGTPLAHEKIENLYDYQCAQEQLRKADKSYFHPKPVIWKAGFDVIATNLEHIGSGIWVSEDVKKALEATGVGMMEFEKIRKTAPRMTGVETPEHRARNARIIEEIRAEAAARPPEPEQVSIQNFRKKQAWRASVLAQKDLVKKHRATNPPPPDDNRAVQILREKELEFDVLLPEKYLEKMRVGLWKKYKGHDGSLFDVVPAERVRGEGGWSKSQPQVVKAIFFAENGLGDYLGFILREGSAYELDDTVYEFLHETGEVVKLGKLR